ncbi:MAG: methionine gamma-lyase family protein [Clostridia bacterium]|nr:methionine gamma-lyase family protein [Clostridia bacterium]
MIDINKLIEESEEKLTKQFKQLDEISLYNQEKVINAFKEYRISARHFAGTNGYGYDDIGRDTLNLVMAQIVGAERAIVSPFLTCGSHALALALFGVLNKSGMKMLAITGKPYDTLDEVIFGVEGKDIASLKDLGVEYAQVELSPNGKFDMPAIKEKINNFKPDLIFIQRSRGYAWRDALDILEIKDAITEIKAYYNNAVIMVDNNYGEFVDKFEPCDVGADLAVGSLIKNAGGGLAPTGAYIAGKASVIEKISYRYTSPSLLLEVGSYAYGYQSFYQGLFMGPHITCQALKGCLLMSTVMRELGYKVLPSEGVLPKDVVTSIELNDKDKLIKLCQIIQSCSPVDSYVCPEPWDMPGYTSQVIMAAGTFVQGASIELSCDAPIREPYILYIQGGLAYEHIKYALKECVKELVKE